MNAAAFILLLQRRNRHVSLLPDPLVGAQRFLERYGRTAEGQAFRKAIEGLITDTGEFTESDASLFSTETLVLISALVEARIEGRYSLTEWTRCVQIGSGNV